MEQKRSRLNERSSTKEWSRRRGPGEKGGRRKSRGGSKGRIQSTPAKPTKSDETQDFWKSCFSGGKVDFDGDANISHRALFSKIPHRKETEESSGRQLRPEREQKEGRGAGGYERSEKKELIPKSLFVAMHTSHSNTAAFIPSSFFPFFECFETGGMIGNEDETFFSKFTHPYCCTSSLDFTLSSVC
jgi:hypothetical protein